MKEKIKPLPQQCSSLQKHFFDKKILNDDLSGFKLGITIYRHFGLLPWNLIHSRLVPRVLVWLVLLASAVATYFSIKAQLASPRKMPTRIVFFMSITSNQMLIIASLLNGNICVSRYCKFFHSVTEMEAILDQLHFKITRSMYISYLEVLALPVFSIINQSLHYYNWLSCKAYSVLVMSSLRPIAQIYTALVATLHLVVTGFVKRRYLMINDGLGKVKGLSERDQIDKIQRLLQLYRRLHDVVESMDDLFQWQRLFCIAVALSYWLDMINYLIFGKLIKKSILAIYLNALHCFLYLISLVVLIMSCDSVEAGSRSVIKTCFMLHESSKSPIVKNYLLQLAQYAQVWGPSLSAANFFNINQSTLTALFKAIITYLVAIIQLNLTVN